MEQCTLRIVHVVKASPYSDPPRCVQVHVLVVSEGHDSCLLRTLQHTAACLTPFAVLHCPVKQPLLPEAVKLGSQEASDLTQHAQALRVQGNTLAANNQGSYQLNGIRFV